MTKGKFSMQRLGYRHAQRGASRNLYIEIRKMLDVSRQSVADAVGLTMDQLAYRERQKQMYHLTEIVELWRYSQLSADEFMQLLNDTA
jgi:hypothetical protein